MKTKYDPTELKDLLNLTVERFNTSDFIIKDPIQFPRRFTRKQDVEVSAFLTATITWGKRELILKSAEEMHQIMGVSPYDYVMSEGYSSLENKNLHRTFFEQDMAYICRGLRSVYNSYDSIESLFASIPASPCRLWDGIKLFRECIYKANGETPCRSLKHISNPEKSACKRLHLALRWLVRNDDIVDLGLWKSISPSELYIPLDTHVISTAHQLELLDRKQNDRKAVEELTSRLRKFNPDDPIIYDFALFGLGESKSL